MGKDLKNALLHLMNGIKANFFFPYYVQLADISSIYKSKGSRFSLESDRGIFILTLLKKVFDKLIYQGKYPAVDINMSDSNIGARRGKKYQKSSLYYLWDNTFSIV